MESMRDTRRIMEKEIKKGSTPLRFEKISIDETCYQEITSRKNNENVKGIKTGTMASSYNIVVLYKKDGKEYLITCLASLSDEGRYKAVQSAINTIIK